LISDEPAERWAGAGVEEKVFGNGGGGHTRQIIPIVVTGKLRKMG